MTDDAASEPAPAETDQQSYPDEAAEVELLTRMLADLRKLSPASREKLLQMVLTFFGMPLRQGFRVTQPTEALPSQLSPGSIAEAASRFSEDRSITPKQFIAEKQPRTDVEKVACLAYYLTHYRETPHFRTLDISKLNTEAAQIKFSNPAFAVENAAKMNYLVPASKGAKQLSYFGEQFVQALPDRERAKAVMAHARPRRKTRKPPTQEQGNS